MNSVGSENAPEQTRFVSDSFMIFQDFCVLQKTWISAPENSLKHIIQ